MRRKCGIRVFNCARVQAEMAEQDGRRSAGGRCVKGLLGATAVSRDHPAEANAAANRTVGFNTVSTNSVNLCGTCPTEDRDDHANLADAIDAAAPLPESRPPSVRRKFRTLTFGRRCKTKVKAKEGSGKKRSKGAPWNFKFNCRLKRAMGSGGCSASDIPEPSTGCEACICTGYRRTEEHHLGAGVVFQVATSAASNESPSSATAAGATEPAIDLLRFNPDDYPIEDWEERARAERARELVEGVDPPPGYRPPSSPRLRFLGPREDRLRISELAAAFQNRLAVSAGYTPHYEPRHPDPALSTETHLISQFAHVTSLGACVQRTVHTQVDYIHCLVPDLREITDCGFYWGKMDRYEAEKLLEAKSEGTFLLRDSAQEEYLFSVSFRRYGRSLHARIEQWNHRFSFDSHDPGVFASETVCGLIEHYKDPSCCMFFEPMLTIPLHRTFPFPLQHLCRSVICKSTSYDGVNELRLPKSMKAYLKEYHYKQRVRVRRFEMEH